MGGLFGGGKETPQPQQPVTLSAPNVAQPGEKAGQGAAQADALKRAQTASTLATGAPTAAGESTDYASQKLGG